MNIDGKIFNKIFTKPNPRTFQKDHPSWSKRLHPRDIGIVQHVKINQCDPFYKQTERKETPS